MKRTALLLLAVTFISTSAMAAGPAKWIEVEGLVNQQSSFMIAVDVDKPNRVYRDGETMTVSFKAEKDCFVYLIYHSGDSSLMLFPNKHQPNNKVPAKKVVQIPGKGATFRFRTTAPFGDEVLQVVATSEPLKAIDKPVADVGFRDLAARDLKAMVVEVKQQEQKDWAEARINIKTIGKGAAAPKTGKRVGVCVGISDYVHERIQDLKVSHLDARRMAEAFKQKCNLDEVLVLTNEQATRKNIEQALFRDLPARTVAGDSVFIFFSGHGGRTSDTNGDEEDGFDEYLVPHDGVLGKPETMILDDTFARWMQELSGRQIAIFMDNCYSGGASKSIDGAKLAPKSITPEGGAKALFYDGIDGEVNRAKDLGQQNTVVLAACMANQLAWEMPPSQKGSVLTHYLLQSLDDKNSDANQDGKLTVQESYAYVKQKVETYVKDKFQAQQNPVIVDNAQDGIIFQQQN